MRKLILALVLAAGVVAAGGIVLHLSYSPEAARLRIVCTSSRKPSIVVGSGSPVVETGTAGCADVLIGAAVAGLATGGSPALTVAPLCQPRRLNALLSVCFFTPSRVAISTSVFRPETQSSRSCSVSAAMPSAAIWPSPGARRSPLNGERVRDTRATTGNGKPARRVPLDLGD
jgi:hypothetical protein